jgi:hypothetical protein
MSLRGGLLYGVGLCFDGSSKHLAIKVLGFTWNLNLEARERSKEKDAVKKHQDFSWNTFEAILNKRFLKNSLALFKDLLKIIKPKYILIKGKFGFYEPCYTAWLCGMLALIDGWGRYISLDVQPIWDEEYLETENAVGGSVIPLVIVLRMLKFLILRETRELISKVKKQKGFKNLQPLSG